MWDLVPWPGIEPGHLALGAEVLTTGPPGKSRGVFEQRYDTRRTVFLEDSVGARLSRRETRLRLIQWSR